MSTTALRKQVAEAVEAIESKKGFDVSVLQMDKGAFTDYLLLCSGSNPRQVQAIADAVDESLGAEGVRPNSVEGYQAAEWILLDYVDMVVQIFVEGTRKFYDLDRLWKSARRVTRAELVSPRAAKRPASASTSKTVKRKTPARTAALRRAIRSVTTARKAEPKAKKKTARTKAKPTEKKTAKKK